MKRTFIPQSHMPPAIPVHQTGLYLLACHYFDAPQWVWTLVCVFLVVIWVSCIHDVFNSTGRRISGFGRKNDE